MKIKIRHTRYKGKEKPDMNGRFWQMVVRKLKEFQNNKFILQFDI